MYSIECSMFYYMYNTVYKHLFMFDHLVTKQSFSNILHHVCCSLNYYNICSVAHSANAVPPEVEVTATLTRVVVGNSTTLTCTVTRSIPMGSYTYRWVHNNSITLSETSSMLTVSILTESDVGVYRCEVTNSAGLSGGNTATIELGGKY